MENHTKESKENELRALMTERARLDEQIVAILKELPDTRPVQDYDLHTLEGSVSLKELFGEKRDLIVIHNMGKACVYCTLWADGFNGLLPHLENRAATVLVSPDSPQIQHDFASSRGWKFRMISGVESTFITDMGYATVRDGKSSYSPGASMFRLMEDGTIIRVAKTFFGPGDQYCSAWHLFDLLDGGAGTWAPEYVY